MWGNAAGGVINVSTVPATDARGFDTQAAAGNFGLWRGVLRGGWPAGPGHVAFSAVRSTFAGWRRHSASRRTLVNVAYRTAAEQATRVGVYAVASDNFYEIPGPLTLAQFNADARQANATYQARIEHRHNRLGRIGVTLAHDASPAFGVDGMLYLQPKFLQRSERGTFRDFTRYHVGGQTGLRLATPLGPRVAGELRAGVDAAYQDGAILFYSLSSAGTRGDTLRNNQREGAGNLGAYVQEELALGRWGVTIGARYDDVTYIAEDFVAGLAARKSYRHVSPKLGATYRLGPFHSVYAALGGGIEAPAGNETDPVSTFGQDTVTALNPLLNAIRSTTYELGTRHRVRLSGALREVSYDIALYDTAVRDEIVPYRGGRFYFSAGSVRRAGIEVGLSARTAGGISLHSALTYAHHRYRQYVVDSVHYGSPGATAGAPVAFVAGLPRNFVIGITLGRGRDL